MKKRKLLLFLSILLLQSGFAEEQEPTYDNDTSSRGTHQKRSYSSSRSKYESMSKSLNNKDVTPSARACPKMEQGAYITADFLWWKSLENIPYTFHHERANPFPNTNTPDAFGVVDNFQNEYDYGFRVGLGYDYPFDGWEFFLNYTWYRNKINEAHSGEATTGSGSASGNQRGYRSLWLESDSATDFFNTVKAEWKFKYDSIDAELGRDFFVSSGLSLKPYIGGKNSWIRRRFIVRYSDGVATSASGEFLGPDTGEYKGIVNYWGIGPKVGFSSKFRFGWGVSFFGDFSTSIYSGLATSNARVHSNDREGGTNPALLDRFLGRKNPRYWNAVTHNQMVIGLSYDQCYKCDKMFFHMELNYEINKLTDLPYFVYPPMDDSVDYNIYGAGQKVSNVSMQGLTIKARFDF